MPLHEPRNGLKAFSLEAESANRACLSDLRAALGVCIGDLGLGALHRGLPRRHALRQRTRARTVDTSWLCMHNKHAAPCSSLISAQEVAHGTMHGHAVNGHQCWPYMNVFKLTQRLAMSIFSHRLEWPASGELCFLAAGGRLLPNTPVQPWAQLRLFWARTTPLLVLTVYNSVTWAQPPIQ
jgi:hypothetical protein